MGTVGSKPSVVGSRPVPKEKSKNDMEPVLWEGRSPDRMTLALWFDSSEPLSPASQFLSVPAIVVSEGLDPGVEGQVFWIVGISE